MKKYLIVETWNGEGYSSENKITEIKEFKNDDQVMHYCNLLALTEVDSYDEYEILMRNNGYIYTIGDDNGSYQYFELNADLYGVVISCNINEVTIVNKHNYFTMMQSLIDNMSIEDVAELGNVECDRVFIDTESCGGDYDIQFEVIKHEV